MQLPARPGQRQLHQRALGTPTGRHHPVLAGGAAERPPEERCEGAVARHAVTEGHVSLLLNCGLLARHSTDRSQYLFSVPDTGPLVRSFFKPSACINMYYLTLWHVH